MMLDHDAELPASDLVASLRSEVMQHWTPPGGGWHGALNHVVIHGLDVTVPLGVPRRSPDATIRVVLDDLTAGGVHGHFGTSIEGRSLRPPTLTGHVDRARHCTARPDTSRWCSAAGQSPRDGSKAIRFAGHTLSLQTDPGH